MKKIIALSAILIGVNTIQAQYSIVDYKPCESLSGISTFVDQVSPSNPMYWEVVNGYSANGYGIIGSCYGGYIEYLQSFTGNSYLEFYCKAFQMGYQNLIPTVSINGVALSTTLLTSNTTGSYIKLKTSNIPSGNHTVRIEYPHTGMYYQYFIDEINTFSDANSSLVEMDNQSFNIFPSFAEDFIEIHGAALMPYSIYNSSGQLMTTGMLGETVTTLFVESYKQGVYYIRVGSSASPKRFVKM